MTGYVHPILNDGYDKTVQRLQEQVEAEQAAWDHALISARILFHSLDGQQPLKLREYLSAILQNYNVDNSLAKHAMSHYRSAGVIQYRLGVGISKTEKQNQ